MQLSRPCTEFQEYTSFIQSSDQLRTARTTHTIVIASKNSHIVLLVHLQTSQVSLHVCVCVCVCVCFIRARMCELQKHTHHGTL